MQKRGPPFWENLERSYGEKQEEPFDLVVNLAIDWQI